ncbi:ferrochelatase [Chlamydia ibidis]|uniref:Ferrochelatase n=2 Tax=Chlamydia ibidis TaxID=1405396 RepID=S7J3F1_9CHLA|nr:ferrochelatase [Chlamydia ibidis]EPP34557.1 ferrochelatase [Chlamydia ibidis]EQM63132.1 ferrochelatase [Chlamydia ibidis 10-1398/6]
MRPAYLLANFGGPRHQKDVENFLVSLLTDSCVTGNFLPPSLHKKLFSFIARRRSPKVTLQYLHIGGKSPIYQDTECLAKQLEDRLLCPVIPFHRYLPDTHETTLQSLSRLEENRQIIGVPMFPHFTYAVTGSIVKFFHTHAKKHNISWIAQFGNHPSYISVMVKHIQQFLLTHEISNKDCCLLFSAHGLPLRYIRNGDPYDMQCEKSFKSLINNLGDMESYLCYQSKFGPGKWLQPSTKHICKTLHTKKRNIIIIPFGFISDHIETLYEIEEEYLPILDKRGYRALRLPAIYSSPLWIDYLIRIITGSPITSYHNLIKT